MFGKSAIALSLAALSLVAATAVPATASTPEAWAKLDKASEAACLAAAKLADATIGPSIRYSDSMGLDARVVTGTWPQPQTKGAKARMLCLYNRKTKRVEVQELADAKPVQAITVADLWWRAEAIGGAGMVTGSEVTMMLGSDGKIGGRAGCNGYSAGYRLDGSALKLAGPVISTRMSCAPALMYQEAAYLKLVENAMSAAIQPDGALLLTAAGGGTVRFVRK